MAFQYEAKDICLLCEMLGMLKISTPYQGKTGSNCKLGERGK